MSCAAESELATTEQDSPTTWATTSANSGAIGATEPQQVEGEHRVALSQRGNRVAPLPRRRAGVEAMDEQHWRALAVSGERDPVAAPENLTRLAAERFPSWMERQKT